MKVQLTPEEDDLPIEDLDDELIDDDELELLDDDEEELEDDDESTEDDDSDDFDEEVEINWKTPEGKDYVKKMKYGELGRTIWESENRKDVDENMNKYVENTVPLVNTFNESTILQHILHYKGQGYSEDQIKEGLVKLWGEELSSKNNYGSYDDEIRDKAAKELEFRTKPLEAKLAKLEEERQIEQTQRHNNVVLQKALAGSGITRNLTEAETQRLVNNLATMYPGQDLRKKMFDDNLANILISATFKSEPIRKNSQVKAITKGTRIPRILSGKGGIRATSGTMKGKEKTENVSMEERIQKKNSFFS